MRASLLAATAAALLALASPAFSEAGGTGGTAGGNGSHNNDNKGPLGENNCAGGGCGVDSPYHAKGTGWPGQGDGLGTQ